MKNSIFIFLFVICSLLIGICNAQWQPDVRLTNYFGHSFTSYNNAWCIASREDFVHVVWYDNRNGYYEIYYKRSTDAGISWGIDTRLTNNTGHSNYPSVAASGSIVHVVWEDESDGNWEIYYKRSTDEGATWGADIRLTNDSAISEFSSLAVSVAILHVIWTDYRNGNAEIYYKSSTDAGVSWGIDTRLTNNTGHSNYPSVAASGSIVHVVWEDESDGNWEIYYKRSTDAGTSWGVDIRLTNDPAFSVLPSIATSGSHVHVVWHDNRDGIDEIYYKRSSDGGVNWGADTRLTNVSAYKELPSISVSGSVVHVVWQDQRDGGQELYYKRSLDGGISWGADTRLTNAPFDSSHPSISISGQVVHVVWYDLRDYNYEIYYKRDPTGNPIGIQPISNEIPNGFFLSQNYPNPFNPGTIIRLNIKEPGFTTLKVFDILGREAAFLVNEQLKAGTYEVEWNASNYPSGVYYYRIAIHSDKLTAEEYSETKKMVLIK